MDFIKRINQNIRIMKEKDSIIQGKKQFETEHGEFVIGEIAYYISTTNIEFSQENEMKTISYPDLTSEEEKKRLLIE